MDTVTDLLAAIASELQQLQLWQPQPPSPAALASRQPFCIDTLTLPQWLQFVFLPRMQHLLEQHQPLPDRCGIAPLAEAYFHPRSEDASRLTRLLQQLDQQLSRSD